MTADQHGSLLPPAFADLEPFAKDWAIPGRNERYQRRLDATMPELQAFYDVGMPRARAALEHIDRYELDDLPDEVLNLMYLLASLSVVSVSVELFSQPKVPDCGATYIEWVEEPAP